MLVLLDNNSGVGPSSMLFEHPHDVILAWEPAEVELAIAALAKALADGKHAAGFFSYELGYALEARLAPLMPQKRCVPLIAFGLFDAPAKVSQSQIAALLEGEEAAIGAIWADWSEADYLRRFREVKEHIEAGDIYQANLTFKARFQAKGSRRSIYRHLRERQKVAYGAYIELDDLSVLSLSPELFFAREARRLLTRPMKGTTKRGASKPADRLARATLAADPKQRAENLMIVDLMRNDVGRLAELGGVSVTDLFTVETFETLHQMTSGVEARLRPDVTLSELLHALHPPGSVTGAPKIKAMEIVRGLESSSRDVYCGAIGHLAPNGDARFNVAIRTALIDGAGRGEIGIGSGVVADSDGAQEYAECLLKLKFLGEVEDGFGLFETLLYEADRGYWLLDRHVERMQRSADELGFHFDGQEMRQALALAVQGRNEPRLRVRLDLARSGDFAISVALAPAAGEALKFVIHKLPIESSDPLMRHKTTRRRRYDEDWAEARDRFGADEVVYLNERGEIAEGSRTNVFIERGGVLLTPPIASGLLPGVLRAELIASGRARELVLTLEDLATGDPLFLGNSLRGLVKAQAIET